MAAGQIDGAHQDAAAADGWWRRGEFAILLAPKRRARRQAAAIERILLRNALLLQFTIPRKRSLDLAPAATTHRAQRHYNRGVKIGRRHGWHGGGIKVGVAHGRRRRRVSSQVVGAHARHGRALAALHATSSRDRRRTSHVGRESKIARSRRWSLVGRARRLVCVRMLVHRGRERAAAAVWKRTGPGRTVCFAHARRRSDLQQMGAPGGERAASCVAPPPTPYRPLDSAIDAGWGSSSL